jgi:membrane-associated HD superfamily phosphohydrolase
MVADTVEAAVRSMKDKNINLDEFIHKLIMETVEDGQLNQSGLSLKDIAMIEKVFRKVLSGVYHNRIEYPDDKSDKENNKRD